MSELTPYHPQDVLLQSLRLLKNLNDLSDISHDDSTLITAKLIASYYTV